MRKRPLMFIVCVFLAGMVYQRYSQWGMAVIGVLLVICELWIGRRTGIFKKAAGRSILLLSAFLLGIFHMWQEEDFRAAYMSKIEDGSRITVWGELIKMESTDYGNRMTLSDCYIDFGEGTMPCNDIMVYTSNDQYILGQILKITGKVNMFSKARNEGNFDSFVYYQSLKIDFAVDEEVGAVVGRNTDFMKGILCTLKEDMRMVYATCLSEKAAGFYQAMVLGDKTALDATLKDLFLLGGISHILAISGLHVSIVGRGVYRFLRNGGIGFGISGICSGILLVFYSIMVGRNPSTIRAVGMMLLFFLSQWMGRSYDMLNSLGAMVLLLLWENPFLIENSGFWFSVTALLGVGFIGQELSRMNLREREKKRLKWRVFDPSGLWVSLGITLATLPVTALAYYEVPMYSVLVNFVVLPLLAPVFCLAVIGGLLGASFSVAGFIDFLLQPCEWLLWFYENVCRLVSQLPNASVICGRPEWWQVIVYYVFLFGGVYLLHIFRVQEKEKRRPCGKVSIVVLGLSFFVCSLCIFFPKSKPFEITFLDVGQGDGIYMSAGDGSTYFIDGGSSSEESVGENRILPFLKAKGVRRVDYWFVSHCDMDHMSGLYEIIKTGYKIEHIVLHERCSDDKKHKALLDAAMEAGIKVVYMEAGHRIYSEDMEILCLAPIVENGATIGDDENENSLVLQVEWKPKEEVKTFTALFAGDISTEIENALCENRLLEDVDLVKANHHGSNYSNGEKWFENICPEYIVVSCSKNNLYGHPGREAVERMVKSGAEIFYTMDGGQITFPLIQ